MTKTLRALMGATAFVALAGAAMAETTITVATVNNGDMVRMQGLMDDFYAKHPDIKVEWVTLEENVLRQNVTTDIATGGGQYDVITIGTYEVPIWGKQGWLESLNDLPADYDVDDLLPAIRGGLTVDGNLFASPFYGESSMVMYRKDLMDAAGMAMPDAPTWADIEKAAAAMTNKDAGIYGVCLRGKAGWGENMAFLTAMSNSFGARWFDEAWNPQFDSPEWKATLDFYLNLMNSYGPPGASNNGFNENLTLFNQGKCGM
ncbi:MAG: sugar ABC transporter substrate-binding protein, partial [Pseudomonadota bacterium]